MPKSWKLTDDQRRKFRRNRVKLALKLMLKQGKSIGLNDKQILDIEPTG